MDASPCMSATKGCSCPQLTPLALECAGTRARMTGPVSSSGGVEFPGAAPFTALVKGAGFSPARNMPRATKRRMAIGQREKRIEDQKTRTLEDRKGAAPENQNRSMAVPPQKTAEYRKNRIISYIDGLLINSF